MNLISSVATGDGSGQFNGILVSGFSVVFLPPGLGSGGQFLKQVVDAVVDVVSDSSYPVYP